MEDDERQTIADDTVAVGHEWIDLQTDVKSAKRTRLNEHDNPWINMVDKGEAKTSGVSNWWSNDKWRENELKKTGVNNSD